jgi:TonB-linked SusC/RagA family outer membrane protein
MRLLLTFLMTGIFIVFSGNVYSQEVKFTLNLENVTIKELLKEIKKRSNYSFWYNNNEINEQESVSVNVKDQPIGRILDIILKDQGLTYEMKDRFVFIYKPSLAKNRSTGKMRITGSITDTLTGKPLSGINISIEGAPPGVTSDENGKYAIELSGSDTVLVFSRLGYATKRIAISGLSVVNLKLSPEIKQLEEIVVLSNGMKLDEIVVVGYGVAKRITNTGSVSAIKAAEIRKVPTSNVQNALSGRIPGLFTQQRSGQPGKDASDFFIRGVSSLNSDGNQPLIIVDDIEYTYEQLSQINVNEIESISVLKDASTTAVFGIKGANGVLVVTTRRGTAGAPKINLRFESGIQSPVKKLHFLNSYESAKLVNEAYQNDGLATIFSQEDLNHFETGDDPYGHPDVNWYKKIFKPSSLQQNANIDISGGDKTIKYFISGGAFSQNGAVRNFEDIYSTQSKVNSNYYFKRFTFRSNLDVVASNNLSLRLDITGRFTRINSPHAGNIVSEIYDFSKIHPYSAPFLNPNGTYTYASDTKDQLPTINARLATKGYDLERRNDMNVLFGGTEKLNFITDGLSFTGRIAYASVESNTREQVRDSNPPTYLYNPKTGSYTLHGSTYTAGNYMLYALQGVYNNRVNVQSYFSYDRYFGKSHITSLLLYNRESYKEKTDDNGSNWIPQNFQGMTFKAGLDFNHIYLLDFNGGYNGSDRFQVKKRFGFFPSVSVGYNISNESFLRDKYVFIDLIKLRSSYGLVGSDKVSGNRYLYEQVYKSGGGYSFGENSTTLGTITEGDLGNSNVTWEKQRSFDAGIDLNLFKSKISMTVDYFRNVRYDQLMTSQSFPLIAGIGMSPTNIARVRNEGFDGQLTFHNHIGRIYYTVTGVFSYAKNKILFENEPAPTYPWLAITGHPIGQVFGYKCLGFYRNEADIEKSAKPITGYAIVPGDLKYADLNNDGVIDQYDKTAIGKPNLPSTSAGLILACNYKGFIISLLFQGTTGYSLSVTGTGIEPFQSQFQPIHQERWTTENKNAKFPRLSTNSTTINSPSAYMSDFWLIDARYLRLKTLELGYEVPIKCLPFKINSARIYVSGYNLFTWTNYSLYQQDPEVTSNTAGDAYQNQRVVNVGIQIGL